jgi:hypothetical protein
MAEDEPKPIRVKFTSRARSERWVSLYANNVSSQLSPWDIRLNFGQIEDATADGKVSVLEFAQVHMSPQHAKSLMQLLEKQLALYEREFGEITWPKPGQLQIDES